MKKLAFLLFLGVSLAAALPGLAELERMIARYAPAPLSADLSRLAPGDRQALTKMIEASRVINDL